MRVRRRRNEVLTVANILVCDDDREIVDAIEIYLSQDGYQIFKAYDGEQAIELAKQNAENIVRALIEPFMEQLDSAYTLDIDWEG